MIKARNLSWFVGRSFLPCSALNSSFRLLRTTRLIAKYIFLFHSFFLFLSINWLKSNEVGIMLCEQNPGVQICMATLKAFPDGSRTTGIRLEPHITRRNNFLTKKYLSLPEVHYRHTFRSGLKAALLERRYDSGTKLSLDWGAAAVRQKYPPWSLCHRHR